MALDAGIGEQGDGAAEGVERVADAVIAPAMAAGAGEGDFEAAAAEPAGGDVVGIGAIHHQERFDLAGQRRLLAEVAHAEQVALALLADIGHQQEAEGADSGSVAPFFQTRADGQQGGQSGAVVGDAGSAETAVGIDGDFVLVARREDGVEVRGEGDVRGGSAFDGDDVAGAIDGGVPAEGAELLEKPGGAFLLEKGGGGHAAELKVLLVDPLLLAGEPLEALADAAVIGQLGEVRPR